MVEKEELEGEFSAIDGEKLGEFVCCLFLHSCKS
jgi:hypothetical protein